MRAIPKRRRGFTLLELMIVLLVMTVLASGLMVPFAAQLQMRRYEETRRALDEAKETLLGFAAAHGRLPCPATQESHGAESFAAGGGAADGNCSNFHDGFLPAAALGLAPLDPDGLANDAWTGPRNRIRYAVAGGGTALNGITNALTRTNGMQAATLPALGAASHYLFICSTGALASAAGCGPAANQLTRRAAFVLLSLGATGAAIPAAGSDEAKNLDGDAVFVSREVSFAAGNEFDDVLLWVPVHLLTHRLLVAGRLP